MVLDNVSAVILAGGGGDHWKIDGHVNPMGYTALVVVDHETMCGHVAYAIKEAGIENTVIVGQWTDQVKIGDCTGITGGQSFIENLEAGLRAVESEKVLLSTCDLPALTSDSLLRFIAKCRDRNHGLIYPIIPLADCKRDFPGLHRTSVRLNEGRFTGGNVFWLDRQKILENLGLMKQLFDYRKSPLKLAGLFGWGTIVKLLLAQAYLPTLAIYQLENKASTILNMPVCSVIADADIGTDVDSLEELNEFRKLRGI